MSFRRRAGVSPIIATLLLIAIAVAAGIVVYIFVGGLSGSLTSGGGGQTTERLQMQAYNFAIDPQNTGGTDVCGCSGQVLELFLSNTGSSSTTVSAVYFDGVAQTLAAGPLTGSGTDVAPTTGNAYYDAVAATLTSSTASGKFGFSAAGASSDLTVPVGGTLQIVVTFSSGATLPAGGSAHTVKVVSSTGATNVFTVAAGKTG